TTRISFVLRSLITFLLTCYYLICFLGDSFTQFRFAEEKEWEAENPCNKQGTAAFLDSKALAKALQELPLYLRLNVEAESIQEDLPQELPQLKPYSVSSQAAAIAPVFSAQASRPPPKTSSIRQQVTPEASQSAADEDLDFLLSLDAPIAEESRDRQPAELECENKDADLQPMHEESGTLTSDSAGSPAEEKQKAAMEEDLEDWLDSMIS
uniref:Apoptosis and caspase activation inhibitor n=1 Tax=Leptobrachium leishanense TaxID=445787 RepID=A0A8C5QXD4_9ANUR